MKKQKILILSLAAVAGMVLTGCSLTPGGSTNDEAPDTSVIEDEIETADEVGTKVALRNAVTPTAQVNMSSAFGYQVLDKTSSTMSVRIIAVVDDYKNLTAASVTSKVVSPRSEKATAGEDEEVIKAEKTFNVTEVYSSLADGDNVSWNGIVESTFAKKYYIIYTLRNIPVAHYYDTIIVKFSATSLAEDAKEFIVNAYGIDGWDSKLTASKISGTTSDYSIKASYSKGADVIIPADHFSVTDCYATKDGTITTIEGYAFTVNAGKITLPDTITTFKYYAFGSISIAEMNIPASLASVSSYSFSSSCKVTNLAYNAISLSATDNANCTATSITVSSSVTSIPNKFFSSSNKPESIVFGGTEAAWEAMKTESNADSGFYYLDVVCADTTYSKVTFHYGEGSLGSYSGDVVVNARNNRLLSDPGSPYVDEKEFKGWFTDESGTSSFDFSNTKVTGDFDLYAVYGEPGDGYSIDKPLAVDTSMNSISASLYPGKDSEYLKFTIPETASADGDWHYFRLDNYTKDDSLSTASSASVSISVFDKDKNALTASTSGLTIRNTSVVQQSTKDTRTIRVFGKANETFYLKASLTGSDDASNNKYVYGDISIKHFTFEGDSVNDAIVLTKDGEGVTPQITDDDNQKVIYKYVADTTEPLILNKTVTKGYPWSNIMIVDASTLEGDPIVDKGSSSTSTYGFDAVAGHTYYVEVSQNETTATNEGKNYFYNLSVTSAPEGYCKSKALDYSIGETVTVKNVNPTGTYYKFTTTKDALYSISTTKGSASYRQKVEIYDSTGAIVSGGTIATSSAGSIFSGSEISLAAGSYTMMVAYDTSSIYTWYDFTFTMSEVSEGDSVNLPKAITPTLGEAMTLKGTEDGQFYKFTASASNYLLADLSALPSGVSVDLLSASGSSLKTKYGTKFAYKTETGTTYILKVSGADEDVSLTFIREDNPALGLDASTAYSLAVDSNGFFDLYPYVQSSSSTQWFKFSVTNDGTYKLFFQATKGGANLTTSGYSADTDLILYDSADSSKSLNSDSSVALVTNDDDAGAHDETLGYSKSGYYEFKLTAGKTYYAKMTIPYSNTYYDALKFGLKEITTGSQASAAEDVGEVASDDTSLTVKGSADGYWSKFLVADGKSMTFALSNENAEAKIYKNSDTKSPVITLKGTTASEATAMPAGTYLIWTKVSDATSLSDVTLALTHGDMPSYSFQNAGGEDDEPIAGSDFDWTKDESTGIWKSNVEGLAKYCSKLTYTFYRAGTFSFDYFVSGEANYDYLEVVQTSADGTKTTHVTKPSGNIDVTSIADATFVSMSFAVAPGDVVTFVYSKDSSGDKGLDAAFLKNIDFDPAA